MTKNVYIEYQLQAALSESKYFDLLVMGGPEGAGCYCFPNEMLRYYLGKLRANYPYLIMDNEAGMEHLSRRVAGDVDVLIIVSDSSARGIRSAGRIRELVENLEISVGEMGLVVNMARPESLDILEPEIAKTGLAVIGSSPYDELVTEYDLRGIPLWELPDESQAWQAVNSLAADLGL
jgi:CO dehydrogenase maturation factor